MKKEIYILIGLVAIFSFVLVLSVQADTLTEASTTPVTPYVANFSSYSVSFKVASSTEIEAQIRLIFPDGFNVSGTENATSSIVASTTSENTIVASSTVSGQEITLWLADGAVALANDTLHFSGIPNILNSYSVGPHTLGIETRTLANELSDSASTTAFTLTGVSSRRPDSDTSPPSSKIINPTDGLSISAGENYVIEGFGTDSGGSTVQSVEVSLDGGKTWFFVQSYAAGSSFSWEYVWKNPTAGEYVIQVRATDSKGNKESPLAGIKVTVAVPVSSVPIEETPAETETETGEKPITEMTVQELREKILDIQQQIITFLNQLIQLVQAQL